MNYFHRPRIVSKTLKERFKDLVRYENGSLLNNLY